MSQINSLIRLARNVSNHSDFIPRLKMGAVLAKRGTPISVGFNKNKTHPSVPYTIHAEVDALLNCTSGSTRGTTMCVYRQMLDGTPALARPCPDCMSALTKAGVTKIIYSVSEYPFYKVERLPS
jgi:deoxycytidylate deaminase